VKKYHSLAAKGEQVDIDDLARNEQIDADAEPAADEHKPSPSNGVVSQNIEQTQTTTGVEAPKQPTVATHSVSAAQTSPVATPNIPAVGGAMPQALLNTGNSLRCSFFSRNGQLTIFTVQDEGMKNLMMSWYYAGYYTGLLEGQQKAYASMQEGG
jgi:hypothetical protein